MFTFDSNKEFQSAHYNTKTKNIHITCCLIDGRPQFQIRITVGDIYNLDDKNVFAAGFKFDRYRPTEGTPSIRFESYDHSLNMYLSNGNNIWMNSNDEALEIIKAFKKLEATVTSDEV